MKNTFTKRALGAAILSATFLLASAANSRADLDYYVIINTTGLSLDSNGPFSLDLQVSPGSDLVTNSVTLSQFSFLGGAGPAGSPNYTAGGFSGSVANTLTLTNSNPVNNEYAIQFDAATTQVAFYVDQTQNSEIGVNAIADQFNVFIDDSNSATGYTIATNDPTSNNTLVTSIFAEGEAQGAVDAYSSVSPDAGVSASISAVPEPGSAALLLLGVAGLAARRRRRA